MPEEPLLLYIVATNQAVIAALVVEREAKLGTKARVPGKSSEKPGYSTQFGTINPHSVSDDSAAGQTSEVTPKLEQRPVYFMSSVLRDARERYPMMQKLLLGILLASRRLRTYFEGRTITVVSSYPLERVLQSKDATGRIAEWAMELSGLGLQFKRADTIKSHALVDFTAEWTETTIETKEEESSLPGKEEPNTWIHYFDGSLSMGQAGVGVLLVSPMGEQLRYVVQMPYKAGLTNNTAKYEGLLARLRMALGVGVTNLIARGDS